MIDQNITTCYSKLSERQKHHTGAYADACAQGRLIADSLVQHFHQYPTVVGSGILAQIASQFAYQDESNGKGYWVGFFAQIECALANRRIGG